MSQGGSLNNRTMWNIRAVFHQATKPFFLVAGALALFLAALGVLLPVLPTTPFIILAAVCFARSSPRLATWLEDHRVFGPMIANWREYGAIAPKYKLIAVVMMTAAFVGSLWAGLSATVLGIQGACLVLAATYVLSRPNGP